MRMAKLSYIVTNLISTFASRTGCFLLSVILALILGCDSKKATTMPTELIGTWRTSHPKYAGLYFKIEKDGFAFSTAEGTVKSYALAKYERSEAVEKKRKTIFHVLYGNRDGQELKVTLKYDAAGGGAISFKNQANIIWLREGAAAQ